MQKRREPLPKDYGREIQRRRREGIGATRRDQRSKWRFRLWLVVMAAAVVIPCAWALS